MTQRVFVRLFILPFIIFIFGIIFIAIFGNMESTGKIIDVSPVLKMMGLMIFSITTLVSTFWFLINSYAYISYIANKRESCKKCDSIINPLNHRCLNCDTHQWY